MSDKRQVTTDALETLGTIIGDSEKRDAIHLAVEPVTAACRLLPGENVGFVAGGAGPCGSPVGIVDPFLKAPVQQGERFWLVVYPRQITSLRHVWTHPAFADVPEQAASPEPPTRSISASEQWLRALADRVDITYNRLMTGAEDWVRDKQAGGWGDYITGGAEMEGEYVPDEFWVHYENVTGKRVANEHRGSFFSCSC